MRIAVLAAEASEVPSELDATVVATGGRAWPGSVHVDDVHESFDVALACGWRAALHLFRIPAGGYAYLVRGLEDAVLYQGDEQRIMAAATYDLPCDLIAETAELERTLAGAHPGARVHRIPLAPQARDFLHAPPRPAGAPLRVAIAARGDAEARAADVLDRVTAPVERDVDAHVLLELVPAPLTLRAAPGALRAGMPAIVTPAFGHDELIDDGRNGFVAEFDDVPGIAERIDRLAHDSEMLERMSAAARETGATLPSAADAARALIGVLEQVAQATPSREWPSRLLLSALAAAQPVSQERKLLESLLRERDRELTELRGQPARQSGNGVKRALGRLRRR